MKPQVFWATVLLCATLLGCSSGGNSGISTQAQLEGCTRQGIMNLVVATDEVLRIVDQITRGLRIDGVTWIRSTNPGDPDHTFVVSNDFAAYSTGAADTRMAGIIIFSDDPTSGGVSVLDTAVVDLEVTSLGGPLTGVVKGEYTFSAAATVRLHGTAEFSMANPNCVATFNIPADQSLTIAGIGLFPVPQLAANVAGFNLFGSTDLKTTAGTNTLEGSLDLFFASEDAEVRGTINGADVPDFSFPVFPDPQSWIDLNRCIEEGDDRVDSVMLAMPRLLLAVLNIGHVEGVFLDRVGTNETDFVMDLLGPTAMLSGTIVKGPTIEDPASVSWQYRAPSINTTGSSLSSNTVTTDVLLTTGRFWGRGTFRVNTLDCSVEFTIGGSQPLRFNFDNERIPGGRMNLTSIVGPFSLATVVDFANNVSGEIVDVTLNGAPVPTRFLDIFDA